MSRYPVYCDACGGSGRSGLEGCGKCDGMGVCFISEEKPVFRPSRTTMLFAVGMVLAALAYVAFQVAAYIHGSR